MNTTNVHYHSEQQRAFTLIELLTVIAIIAILAGLLFPVFGVVRQQIRQQNTMSSLQTLYQAVRLSQEDERRAPAALLGYAEILTGGNLRRPAVPGEEAFVVPMTDSRQRFQVGTDRQNSGYLFREQLKDANVFVNPDNPIKDSKAVGCVYYPSSVWQILGITDTTPPQTHCDPTDMRVVRWQAPNPSDPTLIGDPDMPSDEYAGQLKLFYLMDSLDIGPMLDDNGQAVRYANGDLVYELHYTPDWTHRLGGAVDIFEGSNLPILTQLKYRNPPSDQTIITYITHHAAAAGSSRVPVLLLSGTAKSISVEDAARHLPLRYKQ